MLSTYLSFLQLFYAKIPKNITEKELTDVFGSAAPVKELTLFKVHGTATTNKVNQSLRLLTILRSWWLALQSQVRDVYWLQKYGLCHIDTSSPRHQTSRNDLTQVYLYTLFCWMPRTKTNEHIKLKRYKINFQLEGQDSCLDCICLVYGHSQTYKASFNSASSNSSGMPILWCQLKTITIVDQDDISMMTGKLVKKTRQGAQSQSVLCEPDSLEMYAQIQVNMHGEKLEVQEGANFLCCYANSGLDAGMRNSHLQHSWRGTSCSRQFSTYIYGHEWPHGIEVDGSEYAEAP